MTERDHQNDPLFGLSYTTIRAPRGRVRHAVDFHSPGATACGRECAGWVVVPSEVLDCLDCKSIIFFPVKPSTQPAGKQAGGRRRR